MGELAITPRDTWIEFVQAIHAPVDTEFNPFYWIYRLAIALLDTIVPCRIKSRRRKLRQLFRWLGPFVPAVGVSLTLCCGWSYFSVFRYTVIRPRWCHTGGSNFESTSCRWEMFHSSCVVILLGNILGHYMWCIFRSPGVAQGITNYNQSESDISYDHFPSSASTIQYHPNPYPTYCDKCEMIRPARAHHCKICNKCILQMDHHCPWVNNCIGYKNYRSFVLLLFYLMAGCTYATVMLVVVFYEMMKRRIESHGWSIRGAVYGTGLLDLPLPWQLWYEYRVTGIVDQNVVLRALFPFMFLVGILMFWLLGYHVKLIVSGLTTLEHSSLPHSLTSINPFDYGPTTNLRNVLGSNPIGFILPLPFQPEDSVCSYKTTIRKDH